LAVGRRVSKGVLIMTVWGGELKVVRGFGISPITGVFGAGDILRKGIAVDTAHGNAKGPALEDIVVGEALNQLQVGEG
jgi:hypothetical protein